MEAALVLAIIVLCAWCLPPVLRFTFGVVCIGWTKLIETKKGDPYA